MRTKTRKRRKRKGVGKTEGTKTHHSMMSLDPFGDLGVNTNLGLMDRSMEMRKIKDLYVHHCFAEDVDGYYLIEGYEILDKLGEDEWKQVGWINYEEIGEEDNLEKIDDLRLEQLVEKGMYPVSLDQDDVWIEMLLNGK